MFLNRLILENGHQMSKKGQKIRQETVKKKNSASEQT